MDVSIARERISAIVKPDSITAAQGDFLATHVPIKRLRLLHKFELTPTGGTECTEESVYEEFVRNPENRHQFIVVYGQSGTGKSHLIRWFEARFRAQMPEDEVVLFVRRSDNTLKGTIRQLLAMPEVQEIANREAYDRLTKAVVTEDEEKLKGRIYHDFINEIEHDDGSRDVCLNRIKQKRLTVFLSNDIVRAHLMVEDGPIARIYAKVAANTAVDRETVAQFVPEDFVLPMNLCEDIEASGADAKALRMMQALMADEGGAEEARHTAAYMNCFVNDVIQRCAGIEAGDFRDIFQDIRRELYRLGKRLTLFIEDVTSFTGVDNALLDALIVEHTGMNAGEHLCRISAIIGTTGNYLQHNFRDNHKDRITQFVYIPSDAFDEEGLCEFVGRYLNAMSLQESVISAWQESGAQAEDYPLHAVKEGSLWEFVPIAADKSLCLYPFTRNSIRHLYQSALKKNQQTPRYIIRDMIEPVVMDLLMNHAHFPSTDYGMAHVNHELRYLVQNIVHDEEEAARLLRFLTIWGDGRQERQTRDGVQYIAGLRREMFEEFGLPVDQLLATEAISVAPAPSAEHPAAPAPAPVTTPAAIPADKEERVRQAEAALERWRREGVIDISATGGVSGTLRAAREAMEKYLLSAINWQTAGIPQDNVNKIKDSSVRLVGLEHQTKERTPALYTLSASMESVNVMGVFVRWHVYGAQSWNYAGADFDAYLVTAWTARMRDALTACVRENAMHGASYIEAAIAAEIHRLILSGSLREKNLKRMTVQQLFDPKPPKSGQNSHTKAWNDLSTLLARGRADEVNRKTVQQYFNIPQGDGGSSLLVLDEPQLRSVFGKLLKARLRLPEEAFEAQDAVRRRRDVFAYLKEILARRDQVAEDENKQAQAALDEICGTLGMEVADIDEDDILALAGKAKEFYTESNKTQLPIGFGNLEPVRKRAKQIAKALHDIAAVQGEEDSLALLMVFSSDPVAALEPLRELLRRLKSDLQKAEETVGKRNAALGGTDDADAPTARYAEEIGWLDGCKILLEMEVQA